jgi:hypothetical protein
MRLAKALTFGLTLCAASPALAQTLKCPDKVYTEPELSEIVATERRRSPQMPRPALPNTVVVQRLRCLYLYFEYAEPRVPGKYVVTTIDPFGKIMLVSVSKPYKKSEEGK